MEPVATINDTKLIVEQFATAVQEKNFDLIASLLADDGAFNNRKDGLHLPDDETKTTFMNWFIEELAGTTIDKIGYDTCNGCIIGNPVVIFNDGQFPATKPARGWGNNSLSPMMLGIVDGKINMIKFCNTMNAIKSKFWFQIIGEEIMQYELDANASFDEAYEMVLKKYGQWHESIRQNFRGDGKQLFKPKSDI